MNRRDFIKAAGLGAMFTGLGGCASILGTGREGGRPNVVLIMADDIGYECFGCYGGTSYRTPVLDGLANEGVRFEHCYSQPLCTPSRVKIMTGRSNIRNYSHFSILERDERTFGHMLQASGYRTAVAGKWQLYGAEHYKDLAGTGTTPAGAGFDESCLWQVGRLGSRYWNPLIERNGVPLEGLEERYGPDVFCDFVTAFIRENRDRPFLVYYPMALVHSPFVPTPSSADRESKDRQANFADMVAAMDSVVGRIVSELERLGLRENTLLLFTSDNGTGRRIKSAMGDVTIKGGKSLTTDAGTRVPLIASRPGAVPGGAVCEDLIDFSDFVPTLAELCGASLPEDVALDGRSFLPQLRGERGRPREWIYCYYNPRPGNARFPERRFVRDKRWKLYWSGELFDIANDVLEEKPISPGQGGAEAVAARIKLQAALDSMPARPARIKE
jgi:arylsulfatase A-like enzyme